VRAAAISAALDFAARAPFRSPNDQAEVFGLFLRTALFELPEEGSLLLSRGALHNSLAEAAASGLPKTLEDLISLVGCTDAQRAGLRAEPTRLVPFCPKARLDLFEQL
jgi:hypothetical protein